MAQSCLQPPDWLFCLNINELQKHSLPPCFPSVFDRTGPGEGVGSQEKPSLVQGEEWTSKESAMPEECFFQLYFFNQWIGMFPVKAVYLFTQCPMLSLGARDAGSIAAFLQPLLCWVLNLTCPQPPNILKHHPFPSRTPCAASSAFWQADVLHPEIAQLIWITSSRGQAPSGSPQQDCAPHRHSPQSCQWGLIWCSRYSWEQPLVPLCSLGKAVIATNFFWSTSGK